MARVVAHSVNPFLFGTGSWVYGQIVSLRRWRACVLCKRRENSAAFPFDAVHALTDRSKPAQLRERLGRRLSGGVFPFMRRACLQHGATLIHSHFASQGWTDLPLARALGLPLVCSFYGADIWKNSRDPRWRARYADLFAQGTLFLVEGKAMRAKVASLGCPEHKLVVQHLGVDLAPCVFTPRRRPADGLVRVLVSGRAVEKKGHEFAVRVFARARRELPELRLSLMVMAGSADERARLARLRAVVHEQRVADVVDFPVPRPYAEYRQSLQDYHLYFAPSCHASDGDAEGGAPVSLIDMSASGMPIVASRHCDIPEVAPHDVSGLLFDEQDEARATAALLQVASSPARWEEWGRAGRAHVEHDYSLARQARRLEQIYERCVGSAARSEPAPRAVVGPQRS
jgi:colanic acid/amylovoran biosynthesis glycosyltransferase